MEVSIFTAFLGGIISFLSPCVLPLAPPYLAYLGGTTLEQISGENTAIDPAISRRVFFSAVFFVLGLASVFILLGMGASALGQGLLRYKSEMAFVSGGLIYALGLHFYGLRRALAVGLCVCAVLGAMALLRNNGDMHAGLAEIGWALGAIMAISAIMQVIGLRGQTDHIGWLNREARFEGPAKAGSFGASYVIGMAFAFGWTPCIGPILGTILSLAAQEQTLLAGTVLLGVYALGLGIPFLIAALFVGPFLRWARTFRRHMPMVEKLMGVLLLVVGVLMINGDFERISYFLLDTFPILATIG